MFTLTGLIRSLALTTTIAAAALAAAADSQAAIYSLEQCTTARPGISGWDPSASGSWVYYGNSCSTGGTMSTSFDAGQSHGAGDVATWTFTAPANTTISAISAERRYFRSGTPNPGGFGDSHAQFLIAGATVESCTQLNGCGISDGPGWWDGKDATTAAVRVLCTGANGCPASPVQAELRGIHIDLNDSTAPQVTGLSGSLTSTTTTARQRQLVLSAGDQGGGVYQRRLVIDDVAQTPVTVDDNQGACVKPFSGRVPCRLSASETIAFDTATLSDGPHDIAVRVNDATAVNQAQTPAWTIKVDNQPPAFATPQVSGPNAQVGTQLTCSQGQVDGQAPTVTRQWLRANADGSGVQEIAGATAATYTITGADQGRKLLCRVTATDGGGSTTQTSPTTSGPFADGAVVTSPSAAEATRGGDNRAETTSPTPPTQVAGATVRFGRDSATTQQRRSRWQDSAFTMRGRLVDAEGHPAAGVRVSLTETVRGRVRELGSTTSDRDGNWTASIPRGSSRTITAVASDGSHVSSMTVHQQVRAKITLQAVRTTLRRGGLAEFRGRLFGGATNVREKLVEFQVHYRGAWRTIGTLKVDRSGRFVVRYRFGTAAYGRYTFRARTLPTDGYPFSPGTSTTQHSTVRIR